MPRHGLLAGRHVLLEDREQVVHHRDFERGHLEAVALLGERLEGLDRREEHEVDHVAHRVLRHLLGARRQLLGQEVERLRVGLLARPLRVGREHRPDGPQEPLVERVDDLDPLVLLHAEVLARRADVARPQVAGSEQAAAMTVAADVSFLAISSAWDSIARECWSISFFACGDSSILSGAAAHRGDFSSINFFTPGLRK